MEETRSEGNAPSLELITVLRLLMALYFEKWDLVQRLMKISTDKRATDCHHWSYYLNSFIRGLACFSLYRLTRRRKYHREGSRLTRVLQKLAAQGSAGCQGKYLLLKAEQVSLNTRSSTGDLLEAYKKAAEMTVGWRESLIDEGLAHERAASAFMERDEGVRARPLCFHGKRWGSTC